MSEEVGNAPKEPIDVTIETQQGLKKEKKERSSKSGLIQKIAVGSLITFCVPYIYYTIKVYNYIHENAATEAGPEFTDRPYLSDLWITLVSAIVIYIVKLSIMKGFQPLIRYVGRFEKDDTDEIIDYKTHCSVEKLWHSIWHIFASIAAFWLMKDEKWLPWYAGGNGQFSAGFENTPFTPMSVNNYYIGLVFLGYPLMQAVEHFFIEKRQEDFIEMSLHHITHLCISFSYLMANIIPFGAIIAFLHDVSDIPIAASKGLHMAGYSMPWSVITFLLGQISWIFCRLICLPIIISEERALIYSAGREHLQPYLYMSAVYLYILLILHTYWFFLFMKILKKVAFENEVRDLQNDELKEVDKSKAKEQ